MRVLFERLESFLRCFRFECVERSRSDIVRPGTVLEHDNKRVAAPDGAFHFVNGHFPGPPGPLRGLGFVGFKVVLRLYRQFPRMWPLRRSGRQVALVTGPLLSLVD